DRCQRFMHGNPDFAAGLDLTNADRVVAEMLAAHSHHVGASLPRVEQQREGEPCSGTDRMVSLELFDLALGPRVIAVAAVLIDGYLVPDLPSTRRLVERILQRALDRVVVQSFE